MKLKTRSYLASIFGILLGLCVLFVTSSLVRSEISLRKYAKAFTRVEHPQSTELVDPFGLEADYYPATYADDAFRFKPVYLVGELRSYAGDWRNIQAFYQDKVLNHDGPNGLRVMVLAVELQSDGQETFLEFSGDFSHSPFEYDMLQALRGYYLSRAVPQTGTGRKLYLVYITPDL